MHDTKSEVRAHSRMMAANRLAVACRDCGAVYALDGTHACPHFDGWAGEYATTPAPPEVERPSYRNGHDAGIPF